MSRGLWYIAVQEDLRGQGVDAERSDGRSAKATRMEETGRSRHRRGGRREILGMRDSRVLRQKCLHSSDADEVAAEMHSKRIKGNTRGLHVPLDFILRSATRDLDAWGMGLAARTWIKP